MAARPVNRRPRSARAASRPADPASDPVDPLADTIVAISTPPGRGGIGVVRLSGSRAGEIGRRLFRPAAGASSTTGTSSTTDGSSGIAIDSSAAERPRFGTLRGRDGGPIDHGYLVEFPNFTTGLCQELLSRLQLMVGSENVRVERIMLQ